MSKFQKILWIAKNVFTLLKFPLLWSAIKIESHLTYDERIKLFQLALGAERALEVGSFVGASATSIGAAFRTKGKGKIVCVDTWQNDAMTEGKRDTWQEFCLNTVNFKDYIIPVRGFSTEVIDEVNKHMSSIDFLFIDGDHSYDGVKSDWESYRSFMRPGAIVVFHDYGWAEGVKRVVEDDVRAICRKHGFLPNMWWGTIA